MEILKEDKIKSDFNNRSDIELKTDSQKFREVDIVIVGAGMSGISCGRELKNSSNLSFVILEARDRIGGRINSIEFKNCVGELGASFIHGSSPGNPLFGINCLNE